MKDLLSQLKQKCTSCRTMEECQLISPLGASGRAGDSLKMQGKHVEGWRTNISTKKQIDSDSIRCVNMNSRAEVDTNPWDFREPLLRPQRVITVVQSYQTPLKSSKTPRIVLSICFVDAMAFIMQIASHFPLQSFKIHYHKYMLISFIHTQKSSPATASCKKS